MWKPAGEPTRTRSVEPRGGPGRRSRLATLGMLLAMLGALSATLGATALATAANSQPRPAAALVAAASVASDSESGADIERCAKRAIRTDSPDDDKFKNQHDRVHSANRRVVDHQLDVVHPEECGLVLPGQTFRDDPPSTADDNKSRTHRSFDGRAPPRAIS